ncbi:multidrug transporter [Deinococcus aerolatus]|nr:multidrug transporter [Deinococcus aerolatus]
MVGERRVVATLLSVAAFLLLAGFLSLVAKLYLTDFFGRDLFIGLFDLNNESNMPANFSALILLLSAVTLGVIAWSRRQNASADAFSWRALTFIFGFLALDEAAMLHERTADITRSVVKADGILHYAWVLPYGILALIVGLAFVRFLIQLPGGIRSRVIVAGAVYVMGALGFELLEGLVVSTEGTQNLLNQSLIVVEEGMEMLGVILFIGALLSYIRLYLPGLQLHLRVAAPAAPDAADR